MHAHQPGGRMLIGVLRHSARSLRYALCRLPVVRHLRCAGLRRLTPLRGGRSRGTAIVRWYWEEFLTRHRKEVRGRAMELGATETIVRIGGAAVTSAEAMDLAGHASEVRVVADLS